MRVLFNRIVLVLGGLLVLFAGGVIFEQRESIFPPKIKTPVASLETIPSLAAVLEKAGLSISGQPVVLGDTIIASVSGVRVFFADDKDLDTQVRALQLVLGRLTIDKVPKEIDLRFNKVVIRYAN